MVGLCVKRNSPNFAVDSTKSSSHIFYNWRSVCTVAKRWDLKACSKNGMKTNGMGKSTNGVSMGFVGVSKEKNKGRCCPCILGRNVLHPSKLRQIFSTSERSMANRRGVLAAGWHGTPQYGDPSEIE